MKTIGGGLVSTGPSDSTGAWPLDISLGIGFGGRSWAGSGDFEGWPGGDCAGGTLLGSCLFEDAAPGLRGPSVGGNGAFGFEGLGTCGVTNFALV